MLNGIQKKEATDTRRLLGKKVRDVLNVMREKALEAGAAGLSFEPYVDPNLELKPNQKEHVNECDPALVIFNFKRMVEEGLYPNVPKDDLIRAADWLTSDHNGWGSFMHVWLPAHSQEILSAVAILVGPDTLDEKEIFASVNGQLGNANPVPLSILTTLPVITLSTVLKSSSIAWSSRYKCP